MSQIGSITVEKEKQMALERQKFQEAKAKMLAQQKYKRAVRTTGHIALNIVVALIVLLPLLYAVSIAFMPSSELFTLDLNILPKHPTLENFRQALQKVPLVRFVINSFLVAGLITFGQIISSSLAAFSFSFLDFKGKNVLFMLVMATMMIPGEATIISNYLTVSGWNWLDSYQVLIVPYLTSAMGIFLFRQFYMSFPADLEEAAKLDGCSTYRMFFTIIFPLSRPIIIPLSIAFFLGNWNNYLWPLIVNKKPEYRTVMVYLANMVGGYNTKWNVVIASAMLACLPVFLISLLLQSHLQNSIKMSGIK